MALGHDDKALARSKPQPEPRQHLTKSDAAMQGGGFFFEVRPGWETRILRDDDHVTTVLSIRRLEEALADPTIMAIFIPMDANLGREAARAVCCNRAKAKTVFFEITGD